MQMKLAVAFCPQPFVYLLFQSQLPYGSAGFFFIFPSSSCTPCLLSHLRLQHTVTVARICTAFAPHLCPWVDPPVFALTRLLFSANLWSFALLRSQLVDTAAHTAFAPLSQVYGTWNSHCFRKALAKSFTLALPWQTICLPHFCPQHHPHLCLSERALALA